jgi:hypothetical protein
MIEGKVSIILLKVETAESFWQVLNMIEKRKNGGKIANVILVTRLSKNEWGQNQLGSHKIVEAYDGF